MDPYKHKQVRSTELQKYLNLSDLSIDSENYDTSVALVSLMKMLRNSSLSRYAKQVASTVLFIVNRLQEQEIGDVLPLIVPTIVDVIGECEPGLREFLFLKVKELVGLAKEKITNYCDIILTKVKDYWDSDLFTIAVSLVDEFVKVFNFFFL